MSTVATLQSDLADRMSLDQTVTANSTRLLRWLNQSMFDICSRWPWHFLEEREIIQTVVQKTAGTVSVTNGSTTVTGTSTSFAATDKRSFIQITGDINWYEVTNVASQVLTISPAFGGTTNATASYTLRRVFYDLTTDVDRVIDVRQTSTPAKLTNLGAWTLDLYQPDITTVAAPTAYVLFRLDPDVNAATAKQSQMSFFPIPDAVYNMEVRYTKILGELTSSGDIPLLPVYNHNLIIDGAEWLGAKFLSDDDEGKLKEVYEFGIQKAIERDCANNDYTPILGSTDSQPTSRFIPFPTTFEQPR